MSATVALIKFFLFIFFSIPMFWVARTV